MASPREAMLEQEEELGPLYDLGSLYEEDAHETVTYRYAYGDSVAVQLTVAQERQGDAQVQTVPPMGLQRRNNDD
jgi:hypothetical protein